LNTMRISGDRLKITLKIQHMGQTVRHELSVDHMILVGRSRSCDVTLNDEKISARHCRLYYRNRRLEITDLQSKNGTYLNGIRIDRSEIFIGDQIRIGESLVSLEEDRLSPDSLKALTFPGNFKQRMSFELRADFTGARILNKLMKAYFVSEEKTFGNLNGREPFKQKVHAKNKFSSFLSSLINTFIVFCSQKLNSRLP
jgi:hypothetical protein